MFDLIDDSNFQCLASGIGGVIVPETVNIIECCQDPDNVNIIYIKVTVSGVFLYTPNVSITWDSGGVNISPYFIAGYKGIGLSDIPIDTQCSSATVVIAYDVSSVIPDFATLTDINVTVQMNGIPSAIISNPLVAATNIFVSSNPSATAVLTKGITPTPYKLYFDATTNQLKVLYSSMGTNACLCAINCVNPETDDFTLTVCKDEIQEITVDATSIVGDPTNVNIVFMDSIGNQTVMDIHSVINMDPAKPSAIIYEDPTYINVVPYFVTVNGTPINQSKVKYQILRYENNPDNAVVWKDWTSKSWQSLYDRNIRRGRVYGYAIRFRGEFGETSNLSDWATVEVQ